MQLIADSGSTKTSWRLVKGKNEIIKAHTIGYNPHYFSTDKMEASLRETLLPQLAVNNSSITEVYFYGAGCSTPNSIKLVEKAFAGIFREAKITVDHDLLAAARALCGRNAGIACILGTGSNSCAYDGENITDNVPSLGFMLGDEGAGASLGRRLVRAYIYREMPTDVEAIIYNTYKLDKEIIFNNVYKSELPSRYMAQFTKFMSQHIKHPFIWALAKKEFEAFISTQVIKYDNVHNLPVHFLGSIAFYFKPVLDEIFEEQNLKMGRIIQEPIETLVDFHLSV